MADAKSNRSNKGNPASKRMSNKALTERRARSWRRGQERKAERVKAQEQRAAANRAARAAGLPTPAEQRRLDRREQAEAEA